MEKQAALQREAISEIAILKQENGKLKIDISKLRATHQQDQAAHLTELSNLRSEITRLKTSGKSAPSSEELEVEKRRRTKLETELEAYRRQGRPSDPVNAVNARRVAIALAQHCLELSAELAKLRGVQGSSPDVVIVPQLGAGGGWGLDDDDDSLFSGLT